MANDLGRGWLEIFVTVTPLLSHITSKFNHLSHLMAPAGGLRTYSIAQHLPSNIIYEILQYFSAPLLTGYLDRFPWYLTHICRSWRIEFTSMRRNFWSEIIIFLWRSDQKGRKGQEQTLDVLNMFLERNRGYPFSFKLDAHRIARKSPYLSPIFDKIISESARWRRVTLRRLGIADISALYRVKGKLERLESLDVSFVDYKHDEASTDLFMSAPYFTRMDIYPLSTWNFNWSIMTVLHLRLTQREEMARLPLILSQAMRLEKLSIHFLFGRQSHTSFPSHELITLPNLTALEMSSSPSLLQIVTAPSLKEMHVVTKPSLIEAYLSNKWEAPDVGVLKSFIRRSQCRIQMLVLEDFDASSTIGILSQTPDVVVLYMGRIAGMINVCGWLNEMHRAKTPKLARLRSLSICDSGIPWQGGRELDEIFDFVTWRKTHIEDAGSVIEKLQEIDFGSNWYEENPEDNRGELEDEGAEQLRKLCEIHGIQFSANWDKPEIEGCHDRSSDPYDYSFFSKLHIFG